MDNNYDFITYLFISPKKITISINKKKILNKSIKKKNYLKTYQIIYHMTKLINS